MLTAAELARYRRQVILPEVGVSGQERLAAARVLIVGAGGLGSPVALYLAAAGVGTIGILDDDAVEISNLHRQILHTSGDVGRSKVESAADAVARLNPGVRVREHGERLTESRAAEVFIDYDLVVDGSDNYPTRYVINDACERIGVPWVYGSVERFSGQVSVFQPGGPCYRCLYPEPPAPGTSASCEELGVLGAVPGAIGSLQASEALKLILGIGEPLVGRLLTLDLQRGEARTVAFDRRPDCATCGHAARIRPDDRREVAEDADIEPGELVQYLSDVELLDVREPWEWAIATIGNPRLLSLGELTEKLDTLDRRREMVVYCHHGQRSGMAAAWLRSRGFRARNLIGGIDRWSRDVDPSVPRY